MAKPGQVIVGKSIQEKNPGEVRSSKMAEERKYLRFPLIYRIEHWAQMAAFTTLAITGLVQKFSTAGISIDVIRLLGGIEITRIIHHTAAVILMIEVVYHLGAVFYRTYVRRYRLSMLPTLDDVKNAFQSLLYNFGLAKSRPQQGRYTYDEKVEYWAFVWGAVVMIITGLMMWNPLATTDLLPGEFIPAAKSAHGNEALLAVLAIILWHLYNVLVRTRNKSMFNGYLNEEEMLTDHPIELADIKAGLAETHLPEKLIVQRQRIFWPVYGIAGAVLLFGIYSFVTFEQTAIATAPPAETVVVYAPLTPTPLPTLPPTATPQPTQAGATAAPATWEGGVGALFQQKCIGCHGPNLLSGGLNLSSYASARAGGNSGPGIVPGNPDGSLIIQKQSAGNHPGQFSDQELELIRQWIQAGAPEN
jgi:formate dehydrogenase gamma subunit